MTTPADVLGVDESATDEAVKAAFREQARQFHPDRFDPDNVDADGFRDADPDELFRDVTQARDAFVDPGPEAPSLNHEWKNGVPVTPAEREEPTEHSTGPVGPDEGDGNEFGASRSTEPSSGSGNASGDSTDGPGDGPWNSEASTDDAGIDETIGANIEDGTAESVSVESDGTETTVSRRGLLAAAGIGGTGLLAANWLGFLGSESDNGRTTERAVVGSSESIQDAADRVVPGGTLEIPAGTYSEYLSVDVDMTVVAPDGATLLGNGADVTAITVSDVDVDIEGVTIGNYGSGGIQGGGRDSDISVSNVSVEDSGATGLALEGKTIDIDGVTVRNSTGTGLQLTSTQRGTVAVTGVVATDNEDSGVGVATEGRGIVVIGGEEIAIRNSEATGSGYANVHVEAGDASGQSVEISETLAANSTAKSGIRVDGSSREDDVTIQGTESVNNARGGIEVGAENAIEAVDIDGVTAQKNTGTGLQLRGTQRGTVAVTGVVATDNEDSGVGVATEGRGIVVIGGEEIAIRNSEATGSGYANVHVEAGDASGQSVEISETLAANSTAKSGIRVDGSSGGDDVVIQDLQSTDNSEYGFNLGGESVRIADSDAGENGKGDLYLRDIDRDEADIRNSF